MITPAIISHESAPVIRDRNSAFEIAERIESVAILYGAGPRLFVSEHNISHRLFRELHRIGKKKIPLRGMISHRGALDRPSIRALNCWLEHYYGRKSRYCLPSGALHRFEWADLQRTLALRWVR